LDRREKGKGRREKENAFVIDIPEAEEELYLSSQVLRRSEVGQGR
jgi:hypothetical protein